MNNLLVCAMNCVCFLLTLADQNEITVLYLKYCICATICVQLVWVVLIIILHHCCKLANVLELHVCNNYCSKKGACRFSYPKPIVSSLHVQISEKISNSNDGKPPELYRKIEFHSKRNDRWVNSHVKNVLASWMANIYF